MVKNLIQWSLYAAFLGLLLGGAAYRTSVNLSDSGQERSRGKASNNQPASETVNQQMIEQENQHNQERIILHGQVMKESNRRLSVRLIDGQLLEIFPRAWRYAQNLGFIPKVSDPLSLEGFYVNGKFEASRITNLRNAHTILLRDETGHPLWNANQ